VLAAVAPLLGLLGTVTGMIATFDVLAVFGTGNAKAMAGGISEALITTQTGLLVALPDFTCKGFWASGPHPAAAHRRGGAISATAFVIAKGRMSC
jgi:hypothetical protein